MSLESANARQEIAGDQDTTGNKQTDYDIRSLTDVLRNDSISSPDFGKKNQERSDITSGQKALKSTDTSSNVLPDIAFEGQSERRGQESESITESQSESSREQLAQASSEDEPAAVKKYREKYNKSPEDRDKPPTDNTPEPKPEPKPDRDDRRPEVKVKPKYDTKDLDEAIKTAIDQKLPLVVHVGATWCGPCQKMEGSSWKTIQGDPQLNQKAVYLHLNDDHIKNLSPESQKIARQLQQGVEGYPTVKVVNITDGGNGKPAITEVDKSSAGYLGPAELKQFLYRSLKK